MVDIDNIPKSHFLPGKQQQQLFRQSEESENPVALGTMGLHEFVLPRLTYMYGAALYIVFIEFWQLEFKVALPTRADLCSEHCNRNFLIIFS